MHVITALTTLLHPLSWHQIIKINLTIEVVMKVHVCELLFIAFLTSASFFGWVFGSRQCSADNIAAVREKIATVAKKYVGSTHWCYACPSGHGRNTNKCNYFVYDIGLEAGAKMPKRVFSLRGGPVGASEGGWGKASSLSYWKRVSSPQPGDIVAAHKNNIYHVGIYVGNGETVSANSVNVGRNDWPYCPYPKYYDILYWRYTG